MKIKITIGIPVYKSVDYIEQTMMSVLSQTFCDFEILIVDDCGNDGSIDKILQLQSKHPRGNSIRILHNNSNRGVSFCRNRIIDEAQGHFLYFMDSDDIIEPNTIQLLFSFMDKYKANVVYASYDIEDLVAKNPKQFYKKDFLLFSENDSLAEYAFRYNQVFHVSVCNCLIDIAFLRQNGIRFINTDFWEDMAFTYTLLPKVKNAVILSDITYHYLLRPGSLSHYQKRNFYHKDEIQNNYIAINYLKENCIKYKGRAFLPYYVYNIEMCSFYMICHIIKHAYKINPKYTYAEIRSMVRHPLSICDIITFRDKIIPNLFFYFLGIMPIMLFVPTIHLIGKIKKVI